MTDPIFHIARRADWDGADSEYRISTLGATLDEVGFIHCSTAPQVAEVANAFYRGETDLVVLVIDPAKVGSELRYEPTGGELFPHLYGPLPRDAVTNVVRLGPGADGRFTW